MRKFVRGFFLLIAASAGLTFLGTLAKTLFELSQAIYGDGIYRPDNWKGVGASGILLAFSGTLAGIFSSDSLAAYYRRHVSLRWGTALLVVLLVHRSYYSFSYFLSGGSLAWAAANDDREFIQEILADGDYDLKELYNSWQAAISQDHTEAAEMIAPHMLGEHDPCLAFFYAAAHSRHPDQAAFLKVLVRAGGDPKACERLHDSAFTYARPDPTVVMRYLLEQGVEPSEKLLKELSMPDPRGYWDEVRAVYGLPRPPDQPED
jgi:hypothetical protein